IQLGAVHGRHVDGELYHAAGEEVGQELGRLPGDGVLGFERGRAEVRGEDDVRGREQRVVGRRRLRVEHVDGRRRDMTARQRLGQRLLVNNAAAGAVDDPCALLQLRDLGRTDQSFRLRPAGGVYGQEVAPRQESVQV